MPWNEHASQLFCCSRRCTKWNGPLLLATIAATKIARYVHFIACYTRQLFVQIVSQQNCETSCKKNSLQLQVGPFCRWQNYFKKNCHPTHFFFLTSCFVYVFQVLWNGKKTWPKKPQLPFSGASKIPQICRSSSMETVRSSLSWLPLLCESSLSLRLNTGRNRSLSKQHQEKELLVLSLQIPISSGVESGKSDKELAFYARAKQQFGKRSLQL